MMEQSNKRIWIAGAVLCSCGYILAACCSMISARSLTEAPTVVPRDVCNCETQLDERENKLRALRASIQASSKRLGDLQIAYETPGDPGFTNALDAIHLEKEHYSELEEQLSRLSVAPVASSVPRDVFAAVFICLASYLSVTSILNAKWKPLSEFSWATYVMIVASLVCFNIVEEAITNMYSPVKSHFSWNTFCVSPWSHFFAKFYYFGLHMYAALPLTLLYVRARKVAISVEGFELHHRDGKCGMGDYLEFAERWVFLMIALGSVPLTIVLQATISPAASAWYLLTPSLECMLIFVIVVMFIRNAYRIRGWYKDSRVQLGDWPAQLEAKIPDDPTADFLGKEWWKLPASLVAAVGVFWFLLDIAGVRIPLVEIVNPLD